MKVFIPTKQQAKQHLTFASYQEFLRKEDRLHYYGGDWVDFRGKIKKGEAVFVEVTASMKARNNRVKFWKQHSNTYLPFHSAEQYRAAGYHTPTSIRRELGWTSKQVEEMHGGKFDAMLIVGGGWAGGIKEQRIKGFSRPKAGKQSN